MSESDWQKSSFSSGGTGNCVEVVGGPGAAVRLRESDRPREIVTTAARSWASFVEGIKAGELDNPSR